MFSFIAFVLIQCYDYYPVGICTRTIKCLSSLVCICVVKKNHTCLLSKIGFLLLGPEICIAVKKSTKSGKSPAECYGCGFLIAALPLRTLW